ncbi:MAG: hypothetical protein SV966_04640 [Actinomycetota bacterium]|nr:hypothetical protein [Actinomycetota bacterium]
MPVDLALPLLGHLTAVAAHDDARLIGQPPRLQVGFGGLLSGLELLTLRRPPELVHILEKPLEGLCGSPPPVPRCVLHVVGHQQVTSEAGQAGRGRL